MYVHMLAYHIMIMSLQLEFRGALVLLIPHVLSTMALFNYHSITMSLEDDLFLHIYPRR